MALTHVILSKSVHQKTSIEKIGIIEIAGPNCANSWRPPGVRAFTSVTQAGIAGFGPSLPAPIPAAGRPRNSGNDSPGDAIGRFFGESITKPHTLATPAANSRSPRDNVGIGNDGPAASSATRGEGEARPRKKGEPHRRVRSADRSAALCQPQRTLLRRCLCLSPALEEAHQLGRRPVGDLPQAGHHRHGRPPGKGPTQPAALAVNHCPSPVSEGTQHQHLGGRSGSQPTPSRPVRCVVRGFRPARRARWPGQGQAAATTAGLQRWPSCSAHDWRASATTRHAASVGRKVAVRAQQQNAQAPVALTKLFPGIPLSVLRTAAAV